MQEREFEVEELMLRHVLLTTRELNFRSLVPNWECTYKITKILTKGSHKLEDMQARPLIHPRNVKHVKNIISRNHDKDHA